VVRVRRGLVTAPENRSLSDSQAAIAAVRNAGRTGKARAWELVEVVEAIRERQARLGPRAVRFAWVKARAGTRVNELADELELAKEGVESSVEDEWQGVERVITERGLRQSWKRLRERERRVKGAGMEGVMSRRARVNHVHCCTGKGNLQAWRHKLGESNDPECRRCGMHEETGKHVALVCIYGGEIGRRWGMWEDMDVRERWLKRVKDPDGDHVVDLVETFFRQARPVSGRAGGRGGGGASTHPGAFVWRAGRSSSVLIPCINPKAPERWEHRLIA